MTTIRNSIQLNSVQSSLNTLKTNEFQKARNGVRTANGAAVLTGVAAASELWVIVSPLIGINQNNSANQYSNSKINYISPERDLFEKGLLKYLGTVPPAKASKKDITALEKWLKTTDYNINSASVIESAKFYIKQARAAQAEAGYVFMSDNSNNSWRNSNVSNSSGSNKKKKPKPDDDPEYKALLNRREDVAKELKRSQGLHEQTQKDLKGFESEYRAKHAKNPADQSLYDLRKKILDFRGYVNEAPKRIKAYENLLQQAETWIAEYLQKFNLIHGVKPPILKPTPPALQRPPRSQKPSNQVPKDTRGQEMLNKINRFKKASQAAEDSMGISDANKALEAMKNFDKMTPQQQKKALFDAQMHLF
jgi:hypothetical protein